MGQESEDGCLRTQARPRILGEGMAGTIYRPESISRASEVRARIRQSLRLDILSLMGWITRPWLFSQDGSCEKLPTAKILLQDN